MTSKKRIFFIVITVMITILLEGCSSNIADAVYNNNSIISKESDTFGLDESDEKIDSGMYKAKLKLSGSATIWTYDSSSNDNFKIPYIFSVKSGKAKIVLISPDGTVTTLVENRNKTTMDKTASLNVPIKKGKNRIKLVGFDKADINIELHIEKGTFEKISFSL